MKNAKLKPCPMCGNESPDIHNAYQYDDYECWRIKCLECGLELLNDYHQEDDAIEAWNRRFGEENKHEIN